MRKISSVVVHCSATWPEQDIGVEEIDVWHKARGWSGCGYHYVIRRNAVLEYGRPISQVGAHVRGHNRWSIGICLVGGFESKATDLPEDHFTGNMIVTLTDLLYSLKLVLAEPFTVHGHNEFANKGCPGFDVQTWLKNGDLT